MTHSTRLRRTYRYRLYPTRRQAVALENQLAFACELYNAALEQRRSWWRRGRGVGGFEQSRQLTALRQSGAAPEGMNSWCQGEVLKRLDRTFQAFFGRVKRGEKPGYPRFRSKRRYDSLTWQMESGGGGGCAIRDGRLRLQGIGHVKVKWHREIPDEAKVCAATVRRSCDKWYVCFALDLPQPEPLPSTGEDTGIDLGILSFAALSSGEALVGPRAFRSSQAELRRAQRGVARRKRGSRRRRKAGALVAQKHEHIREIRRDHAHKLARQLVERFDCIYIEDLNVAGLARSFLAKDVLDQGWTRFVTILRGKAEEAGRAVVAVDPRQTSQLCSGCGSHVPKPLSERVHRCGCGLELDRDVNAARNILRFGRNLQAQTEGVPSLA